MNSYVLGLMSGTSLDGLDLCYAEFYNENGKWNFKILCAQTLPYSKNWKQKLYESHLLSGEKLTELNSDYGFYLGNACKKFIKNNQISKLNLIASHGHTVFHQPEKKFTLQIGDGRAIKAITQIPVVYDFRTEDVLLGGNGAPLVPIGDSLLFSEYQSCLNLGGFSNISFEQHNKRIAFDICPVNIVLNYLAQKAGNEYDENGELARKGKVNNAILEKLNQLDFYQKKPPKSLGREWVSQSIFPLLQDKNIEDLSATFVEHIAVQISNILKKYELKTVLITGGGAYHQFLLERLKEHADTKIILPDEKIINYKEALIFGLMGLLKKMEKINVLSSVTGSKNDHCAGIWVK